MVLGYKPGSQNVAFVKAELWSAVHIGIAIVCACLPTLRPLLTRATTSATSLRRKLYGSQGTDGSVGYSTTSSAGSKNKAGVEVHALKSVSNSSSPTDPHGDTTFLTRGSVEIRTGGAIIQQF